MAFLADGELAEQALNHASPLDREHKRLVAFGEADVIIITDLDGYRSSHLHRVLAV